jgi:hypothetical protein
MSTGIIRISEEDLEMLPDFKSINDYIGRISVANFIAESQIENLGHVSKRGLTKDTKLREDALSDHLIVGWLDKSSNNSHFWLQGIVFSPSEGGFHEIRGKSYRVCKKPEGMIGIYEYTFMTQDPYIIKNPGKSGILLNKIYALSDGCYG